MKLTFATVGTFALVAASMVSGAALHGDAERARIIQHVNSQPDLGWTAAAYERFAGQPIHAAKRQLGALLDESFEHQLPVKVHTGFDIAALPDHFDSREEWPMCKSIKEIRDQSDCGSCWAFGAVEAASDRICIATKGANQAHLSAQDLLSCCTSCGFGCNGGYPAAAWKYLTQVGVVTGGNYGDFSMCSSYSMPNCGHHVDNGRFPSCGQHEYPTPACPSKCDANSTYTTPFAQDKQKFKTSYSVPSDPAQIQMEIMTNGPVEASFRVYADFMTYKSGVYRHTTGSYLGGHAIKLLGWGVDEQSKLPYWLAANSWNEDWAESGFFRILRGQDECNIEDGIVAGKFL